MTTAADRVHAALGELRTAVDALNRGIGDVDSTTVEEAAAALAELRDLIGPLRQCEAGLERRIATCFRAEDWGKQRELVGVGMVEVMRSAGRHAWDWPELKSAWLNAYMSSLGGVIPDVSAIRDAFFESFSVSAGKVGGLSALGIDANDYCSLNPGPPRVQIA